MANQSMKTLTSKQIKNAEEKLGGKCTNSLSSFIYKLNGFTIYIDQAFRNISPTVSIYTTNIDPEVELDFTVAKESLHQDVINRVTNASYDIPNTDFTDKKSILSFDIKGTLAHNEGIEVIKYVLTEITNYLKEHGYQNCCADCKTTDNLKSFSSDGITTLLCPSCQTKRIDSYKNRTTENYLANKEKISRGITVTAIVGVLSFLFLTLFINFNSPLISALGTGALTTLTLVTLYRFVAGSFTKKSIAITFLLTAIIITLQGLAIGFIYESTYQHFAIYITWFISFILMCKLHYGGIRDPRELIEVDTTGITEN